ncbi:MAG TPA: hypothetical protein VNG53_04295, partial [Bacteroidia bacterium]|nr:hypothetical protein [Bacteroidia bacterium]
EEDIQKIMPYVKIDKSTIDNSLPLKNIFKYGKSEWTSGFEQTLEKSKGYLSEGNSAYLGSPQKIFSRYRFHASTNFYAGFSAEKDAGELFFRRAEKHGFDYYSGYLCVKNKGVFKNVVVGDYQVSFGQGLTVWTGFGMGKSSAAINIAKSGVGFRQHTSFDEINFFRGIASTIAIKNFEISTFVSDKKTDANIISNFDTNDSLAASSLQKSGLHRSINELNDKNSIKEKVFGGNVTYTKNDFTFGFTALKTSFDKPIKKNTALYKLYSFSGKTNTNAGLNYGFSYHNFYFFGEGAISQNGGWAYLNGVMASLSPTFSAAILQRNYARNYQNFFSNGFSENTSVSNEKGIYIGITMQPFNAFSISAYADYFKFPWLKYLVDAPSNGNEYLLKINYSLSTNTKMEFRYLQHNTFKNNPTSGIITNILPVNQTNYRFQLTYKATDFITLKNRVEYVAHHQESIVPSDGYLISQIIYFKKLNFPIAASINYTLFQTDTYDSRIYVLENDFYNRYGISAFFYKGSAITVSLKYIFSKNIKLMLRAKQFFYPTKNTIGSAYDEIQGNKKTSVGAQLQILF